MKTKCGKFTDQHIAELRYLESLPYDQINIADLPEMLDWSDSRQGLFYRSEKATDNHTLGH